MSRYVLELHDIDPGRVAAVGGKAAGLGELTRMDGVRVPPGFCVTTDAFLDVVGATPAIGGLLDRLDRASPTDAAALRELAAELRGLFEETAIPAEPAWAITRALDRLGPDAPCAVRSSATAEDSPTTSFAGQHDTALNVVGREEVLGHVRRCWASLFTERAVGYRRHHGIPHGSVRMAVVVQRMVLPLASGVLFTADPVTGHRGVCTVDAVPGLGEALVSGLVTPDAWAVRDERILSRAISVGRTAVGASPTGGTAGESVADRERSRPTLTDEQVVALTRLGRRIEGHLGRPQDVEWCLTDDGFEIVQSRPITTLFPVPEADDDEAHVYVSVGHQQMMTDPMKPLGLSLFRLTALPRMHEAAGRLFVDVAPRLADPATRTMVLDALGTSDPLIGDALRTLVERGDLVPAPPAGPAPAGPPVAATPDLLDADPAVVAGLIAANEASVAALERAMETVPGPAVVDAVVADVEELRRLLFDPGSHRVIIAGMEATRWLNDRLESWLGERNAADALAQSAPGNVTAEMGLALLDVADVVRPFPEVVAALEDVGDDGDLGRLDGLPGGPEASDALRAYLDRYGMRCVGEIDITRPRWSERPSTLVPLLLGNVRNFAPGEGRRRFEAGARAALATEQDLLERLRALPDGDAKAAETAAMIARVRTFNGYREYPKYGFVRRYAVYKRALLAEAARLVGAGTLRDAEDVFFLTLQELGDVSRSGVVDPGLIARRREAFRAHGSLTPPRVITSDGETISGSYRRDDVPAGALAGLAVSGGTVEGRARVVLDVEDADLRAGDVLVTTFTDPSWSPAFVAIAGLVTEVGGLMTHGAVIAREYGLPAVVGVEGATARIRDGQRVRVHGTDGFVELLDDEPAERLAADA